MDSQPVLLKYADVQSRLSVSRSTVYRLVRDGALTSVKVGRSRRVLADSVAALAQRLLEEQA